LVGWIGSVGRDRTVREAAIRANGRIADVPWVPGHFRAAPSASAACRKQSSCDPVIRSFAMP
jgi:hypothetical protein